MPFRFRLSASTPVRPLPSNNMEVGSGTGAAAVTVILNSLVTRVSCAPSSVPPIKEVVNVYVPGVAPAPTMTSKRLTAPEFAPPAKEAGTKVKKGPMSTLKNALGGETRFASMLLRKTVDPPIFAMVPNIERVLPAATLPGGEIVRVTGSALATAGITASSTNVIVRSIGFLVFTINLLPFCQSHGIVTRLPLVNGPPAYEPLSVRLELPPGVLLVNDTVVLTEPPGARLPRFCGNGVPVVKPSFAVVSITLSAVAEPMFWTVTDASTVEAFARVNCEVTTSLTPPHGVVH